MTTDLFAKLNPEQAEAVRAIDGPLLILAGPGSGKTRVITHRIANIVQHNVAPWRILAVTLCAPVGPATFPLQVTKAAGLSHRIDQRPLSLPALSGP